MKNPLIQNNNAASAVILSGRRFLLSYNPPAFTGKLNYQLPVNWLVDWVGDWVVIWVVDWVVIWVVDWVVTDQIPEEL